MRHQEKHQMNADDLYFAQAVGALHNSQLIESDNEGDMYVAELARRIGMHDSEDGQSVAAFDWIN